MVVQVCFVGVQGCERTKGESMSGECVMVGRERKSDARGGQKSRRTRSLFALLTCSYGNGSVRWW